MLTGQHKRVDGLNSFLLLEEKIRKLKSAGLYRKHTVTAHVASSPGNSRSGNKEIQTWCSNDYLGLGQDSRIINGRIQMRSATPWVSMNEGGVLWAVAQQFAVHSQR